MVRCIWGLIPAPLWQVPTRATTEAMPSATPTDMSKPAMKVQTTVGGPSLVSSRLVLQLSATTHQVGGRSSTGPC